MSIITAVQWVPRGFAAPQPTKYQLDEAEYGRIAGLAKLQLDDARQDFEEAQASENSPDDGRDADEDSDENGDEDGDEDGKDSMRPPASSAAKAKAAKSASEVDDDLKEYDLEHYDDDDEDNDKGPARGHTMGMFGDIKTLSYYESNRDDPYITLKGDADDEDEDEQEEADLRILATDNLILASKVEDEVAHLEIYVYEDAADNLYVHHDMMLPAIPLCVEWLDFAVEKAGMVNREAAANFVAIGTMDPDIEIWDLDTVDSMYPNAILGRPKGEVEAEGGGEVDDDDGSVKDKKNNKKKKKKMAKSVKTNDAYHVDAVLSLAANRRHRNLLASASADKTIKLWDLTTTKCAKSYSYHTDKVCSLAWHRAESTVLLSGSYDRTVVAADMRAPDAAERPRWGVESDVETVRWDPHDDNLFFVSTESGMVHCHDIRAAPAARSAARPVWTLQAHDESVTSFDVNPAIPGFLATGSTDRTVKLWNVQPAGAGPSMVISRNLDVGKVFSATFAPDPEVAFRLAVAGSQGMMRVWDTSTNAAVRRAFAGRVPEHPAGGAAELRERVVGVAEDDDDDGGESSGESGDERGGESGGESGGGAGGSMDED